MLGGMSRGGAAGGAAAAGAGAAGAAGGGDAGGGAAGASAGAPPWLSCTTASSQAVSSRRLWHSTAGRPGKSRTPRYV